MVLMDAGWHIPLILHFDAWLRRSISGIIGRAQSISYPCCDVSVGVYLQYLKPGKSRTRELTYSTNCPLQNMHASFILKACMITQPKNPIKHGEM